jgi:hypothetical protein
MAENMDQSGQVSEPSAEQILSEISSPSQTTEQVVTQERQQAEKQEQDMFEYSAAGRVVKEPRDLVLKRASMGYDYAQKMEAFKKEQEAFAAERTRLDQEISPLKPILDYAKQNPEWEKHVRESWEKREEFKNGTLETLDPVLREELGQVRNFIKEYENERLNKQRESEDNKLIGSIQAVQKEFPDIDLKQADEQGRTLEYRVLDHANKNGINSFKAAFRDYMFDDIISRKAEAAKEALAKELASRTKSGLLGTTQAPIMNGSVETKSKSWNDLTNMALKEIGAK